MEGLIESELGRRAAALEAAMPALHHDLPFPSSAFAEVWTKAQFDLRVLTVLYLRNRESIRDRLTWAVLIRERYLDLKAVLWPDEETFSDDPTDLDAAEDDVRTARRWARTPFEELWNAK